MGLDFGGLRRLSKELKKKEGRVSFAEGAAQGRREHVYKNLKDDLMDVGGTEGKGGSQSCRTLMPTGRMVNFSLRVSGTINRV